ncbi:class I adenylate-forming enzyme family protein [Nitrosopumilus adriaticus]|uniref:4-hydroxybutyryl-CoA dehydratase n=1 Tax=Nitrosopumilus adriaticus TaxID=1580092 RepID=A0A0D5C627_9ARCH|nr:class I adenylate-forming enzyme family protein [Nitrosopumilus adriaticus]AJW71800.1 4-hydroxybutyryl-CoA dehydratase [Nitrosopumilus adriaticus]
MNIINHIKNNADKHPAKIAVIDEQRQITFNELYQKIQNFSTIFSSKNQKIISLVSENSISFLISYLGLINSGKTVHLIPPKISQDNLLNQINSSESGAIICPKIIKNEWKENDSTNIPIFEFGENISIKGNDDNELKKNELAYLIYTSGTTSEPKGVAISHSMIEFTTKNIINVLGYTNQDIDLLPLPLHHSFGLGCVHSSLNVGSTLILLKNASNLEQLLESIKKFNATTLAVIPATLTKLLMFDKYILEDYFTDLRLIITNSTSIPKDTVQNFKKIMKKGNLATYYGLTEASRSTFMIFDNDNNREESVGKAAPDVEIKIDTNDQDGINIGEILIKGKNVIQNYWKNSEADKKIVNGWLRTGDLGFLDEEKYLFLKGRHDEIINIGGEKVSPLEIEGVVKKLSGVEDIAAFGIEHKIFGQTIKVNIVKTKNSDLDKSQVLSYCIKNLEKYKIPSKIEFVEKIPKTDYGKVKRFMLK